MLRFQYDPLFLFLHFRSLFRFCFRCALPPATSAGNHGHCYFFVLASIVSGFQFVIATLFSELVGCLFVSYQLQVRICAANAAVTAARKCPEEFLSALCNRAKLLDNFLLGSSRGNSLLRAVCLQVGHTCISNMVVCLLEGSSLPYRWLELSWRIFEVEISKFQSAFLFRIQNCHSMNDGYGTAWSFVCRSGAAGNLVG